MNSLIVMSFFAVSIIVGFIGIFLRKVIAFRFVSFLILFLFILLHFIFIFIFIFILKIKIYCFNSI